jgi:hypothetical protein
MARTNTVLAPFERVTWDQWQYFRVDEPVEPDRDRSKVSTATGPTGEKLYSIHIAPGVARSNQHDHPREKCLHWVLELMQQFPDRPPKPKRKLYKEAASKFPGLSGRAFAHCISDAQKSMRHTKWSEPGRPSNSPQKSLHEN